MRYKARIIELNNVDSKFPLITVGLECFICTLLSIDEVKKKLKEVPYFTFGVEFDDVTIDKTHFKDHFNSKGQYFMFAKQLELLEEETIATECETLVVNLIGGQGSGKSTMMADLFSWLKWNNIDCEMCTEFAKELVWENRQDTFKDELYIFAKQHHRLFRCNKKVKVIVTDRPLIMSVVYNQVYGNKDNVAWNSAYESIVRETFSQYRNYNIFLNRVKPFNSNGRNETENQAREFDGKFLQSLDEIGIKYHLYDGCENSVEVIGNDILKELSKSNKCYHRNSKGLLTIAYDSSYEMRSSEMHCNQCGLHGTREELEGAE